MGITDHTLIACAGCGRGVRPSEALWVDEHPFCGYDSCINWYFACKDYDVRHSGELPVVEIKIEREP